MSDTRNTNFVQRHGDALFDHHYPIIPIRPHSKVPAIDAWQKTRVDETALARWASVPACGIGVLTGEIAGVDVDCDDPAVVDEFIQGCHLLFGECPVRYGRPGRAMLVYRTKVPRGKVRSRAYVAGHDVYRLELLGKGQQFVAYGVHPDTHKDYHWEGVPLHQWPREQLPCIDSDAAAAMVALFEDLMGKAGYKAQGENRGEFDTLASIKPTLDLSDDHVALVLSALPADDYDEWLQVGMALHHQYNGSDGGLQVWHTWSEQSDKYHADVVDAKWTSFAAIRQGDIVTFATLIQRSGVKLTGEDPLADMLQRYVHIEEGNRVGDLQRLPATAFCTLPEFKASRSNVRVKIKQGKKGTQSVAVTSLWLTNPVRKTAQRCLYAPGEPTLFTRDGVMYYNTFSFPNHVDTGRDHRVKTFLDHVGYLFPVEHEREWFLDWLAHVVQRPHERPPTSVLHVSRPHGTGRGLVNRTLRAVVGSWNCKQTTIKDLIDSDYSEYLFESLFVFIDETKGAGNRFEVSDKMRDKLTERVLPVNVKYGFKGDAAIFSRVFMGTNHFDALKLPLEDRRVNVFEGPEVLREAAYYRRYADEWLIDPDSAAQVFFWLKRRDIGAWDMQRSIQTRARTQMIEFTRTSTEEAFFELLADLPQPIMTASQVIDVMTQRAGGNMMDVDLSEKQVVKLLQENAVKLRQMSVDGKKLRGWNLTPTKGYSDKEIRECLGGKVLDTVVSI